MRWRHGVEGSRLGYLLNGAGFFHQAHRAVDEATRCSRILAFETPTIGASALAVLLDQARKKTIRVWAEQSPFDLKDVLKRGYRWCDGSDGRPRSWHIDVGEDQLGNEIAFLKTEIYHLRSGAAIADLDGAQPIFRQSVDRENSRSTSPPDGENVGFETESLPTHGG